MVSPITLANLRTGGGNKPPIMIIYGTPGIGKTTLAAQCGSPIFVQTEDGLTSPSLASVPTFGVMQSYEQVLEALSVIYENAESQGWRTIVIDSLSKLDPLLEDCVCRENGFKRLGDVAFGKGYEPYREKWRELMSIMLAMRNDKGLAVVLLDHVRIATMNPPDSDSYKKYYPALSDRVAPLLTADADAVLFATYPITTISTDAGFNKKLTRAIADKPRLYCQERGPHVAKNRYQMPEFIPMQIADLAKYMPTLPMPASTNSAAPVAAE